MTHALADVASIVFISTAVNHLGLIPAIEGMAKIPLPIVNCPKCLSFWLTLAYGFVCCDTIAASNLITVLATSFLAAWSATWLELGMASIDYLYMHIYETLYPQPHHDHTPAADSASGLPDSPVSGVQQTSGNEPHNQ